MDKHRNRHYDRKKKRGDGVIHMTPTTLSYPERVEEAISKPVRNPKKKKSAKETQASISIHGAFGQTLVSLHKQGR
ncbi:hypothetical protein ACQVWA_25180 [Bacillus cereus]|uniref:hypothetical protein n=1 Tax=Bacillus cereus TaxID=1396 RepID=UPI003D6524B5